MKNHIYNREYERIIKGVPIFSERDDYIKNYEVIAEDHLACLSKNDSNPFMTSNQIQASVIAAQSMICRFLNSGESILDAGVGCGQVLKPLKNYQRYGVDIAISYLNKAKENDIEVSMAKLEELPYRDKLFDAVISCDVLEHVFKLDQVCSQLIRVLKPGGVLIVQVPNDEDLSSYLTNTQSYSHSHVRRFDLNSIRLYFEKCFGLQFITHEYVDYSFNIASQMKFQTPKKEQLINELLKHISEPISEVNVLKKLLTVNFEELVDAIINLKDKHPEIYRTIAPELVNSVELIVVFRKKSDISIK